VRPVPFPDDFDIVGSITDVVRIASGARLRAAPWLRDTYGRGDWIKRKGVATVRLPDGTIRKAEVHWYEAHGIGKKDFKIKRYVDRSPYD